MIEGEFNAEFVSAVVNGTDPDFGESKKLGFQFTLEVELSLKYLASSTWRTIHDYRRQRCRSWIVFALCLTSYKLIKKCKHILLPGLNR
jgi:hypothetical protein